MPGVAICVYNFPTWLCMKRKYLIMSLVILGPKQPGVDIDGYWAYLVVRHCLDVVHIVKNVLESLLVLLNVPGKKRGAQ